MRPAVWLARRVLAAAMALASCAALADDGKPIRVIVPYAAGGLIDTMTRIVTNRMAESLRAPVIVENRPGANANIGAALVANAVGDGHTLLASSSYFTTNPLLEQRLSWSTDQFAPVARFALSPSIVAVSSSSPYTTLQDLLAAAKTASVSAAESGAGASQTMVTGILRDSAAVRFLTVQYAQGGTSYISDLVNGTVDMAVIPMSVGLGLVKSGRVRALAITSTSRSALLPNAPTMAEGGVPDAGINSWVGLHAPASTPTEALKRIAEAVREAARDEGVRSQLANVGAQDAYLDTSAFREFLREDLKRGHRFVKLRSGMTVTSR